MLSNSVGSVRSLWVAVAILAVGCSPPQGEAPASDARPSMPPVTVQVAVAEQRPVQAEISTVGSLRSPETTTVAADVSGIIVSLSAPEGRTIQQGQEIAQLDDATARAALQVAEARNANANATLQRVGPLVRDGVVPQQMLDDAQAEMATAEGLLEEARTRLGKTRIVAPFTGLVGIQTAQTGQFVNSGDAIIQLTKLNPLELVFGVPEEQAAAVRVGQSVKAQVGRCGSSFAAVVQALDAHIDQQARTLAVQARVPNADRSLIPGMSVRVRLAVGQASEALVIPREALVAQGSGYIVWTLDSENVVHQRTIRVGRFLPDVVEIREGLAAGERVIAAGHQKVRSGAAVAPTPWEETDNQGLDLGTRGLAGDDCRS